jgi:hypothetical protein
VSKSWTGLALALGMLANVGSAWSAEPFLLLRLDGHLVKWGEAELGRGATVRYALVDKPLRFPGARNCTDMTGVEPLLARSGIDAARFRKEVAAAFAMWESAADIKFVNVTDPANADILIGAQATPRGWAFANVVYDRAAGTKVRSIEKSLICLNPEKPWKTAFGGDSAAYDVRYTIAHEIGHAIGLDHPDSADQLMSFRYGERFRTLQAGDLRAAVALYGKAGAPATAGAPPAAGTGTPEMGLR